MIDYGLFHYAAPPRCANSWFKCAMGYAGLTSWVGHTGDRNICSWYEHIPHLSTPQKVLKVSLVRHPYSWLQSYYANYRNRKTRIPMVDRFLPLPCDSFDEFVRAYLHDIPGAVGEMFSSYEADTVLRLEDLPHAVDLLLESLGVTLVRNDFCRGKMNVTGKLPTVLDSRLRKQVVEAEQEIIDRYEYW
jgi:hypothetical protein